MAETFPKPMPKEICCTNNLLTINYLKKYYPEVPIDDFIKKILSSGTFLATDIQRGKSVPVDKAYLLNPDNWISSELFNLLMIKGKEYTNDPLFSYKVGRESFSFKELGIRKTILRLINPQEIVKKIPQENDKFNRTKRIEIIKNEKKQAVVRLHFKKHLVENNLTSKEACAQNRGVYEGLGLLTGHLTSVEERCCTFEGNDYCEFVINWKYKSFILRILDLFRRWVAKDIINDLEDKERQNLDLIHEQELVIESRINELKETQAKLVEAEKRSLEHRITGGFAHEMRNALAGAQLEFNTALNYKNKGKSSSDVLKDTATILLKNINQIHEEFNIPKEKVVTHFIPEIKAIAEIANHLSETISGVSKDLDRGLSITSQIRDYAKMSELKAGNDKVDIMKLIRGYKDRYARDFEINNIKYCVEGPEEVIVVSDEIHLNSIFSNLILNAKDALKEKGSNDSDINVFVENQYHESGNKIVVKVHDNGPGISEQNLTEIFEPFFSTKPTSGTGLGLAIVKKIVHLYGGDIKVESKLGKGATFTITFRENTNHEFTEL